MPVLFRHSLRETEEETNVNLENIFTVDPVKITSPSTDAEVALALRVLEGCCLLHKESTVLAHNYKAIQVLEFGLIAFTSHFKYYLNGLSLVFFLKPWSIYVWNIANFI